MNDEKVKAKVWWVCAWADYYPDGALGNVIGTFYTQDEAEWFMELQKIEMGIHGPVYGYNFEVINVSTLLGLYE